MLISDITQAIYDRIASQIVGQRYPVVIKAKVMGQFDREHDSFFEVHVSSFTVFDERFEISYFVISSPGDPNIPFPQGFFEHKYEEFLRVFLKKYFNLSRFDITFNTA